MSVSDWKNSNWYRRFEEKAILLLFVVLSPILLLLLAPISLWLFLRDSRPKNRYAVALAREEFAKKTGRYPDTTRIIKTTNERCYVMASPGHYCFNDQGEKTFFVRHPAITIYAIWYSDGRIRKVGSSESRWGIDPRKIAARYEAEIVNSADRDYVPPSYSLEPD